MVNILLEGFDINAPWLMPELRRYLKHGDRVAVIALSFRDSQVKDIDDWNRAYARDGGLYYGGIVGPLADYGIAEDDVAFINYFTDSREEAVHKIENADVLYFPGGLPDRMLMRIDEMGIRDALMAHRGVVMGYSAGAVIQMAEYHLSPDKDYPEFSYYKGLPWLSGFYLEVHYEGAEEQDEAIRRVLEEKRRTVYATDFMKGALISDDGNMKLLGDVRVFEP